MTRRIVLLMLLSINTLSAADATYTNLPLDQFMTRWLVLKPIPAGPDEPAQRKAFAVDQLAPRDVRPVPGVKVPIAGREFQWKLIESPGFIVNLKPDDQPSDYSIAYAWAEIDMPANTKAVLGIGSDDGVKVWLNGALIHQNWAARSTQADDDAIPVELRAGRNQLLLKIQNIQGDWSFACHLMGAQSLANKLVSKSRDPGDVDTVKKLLDTGLVNVNAVDYHGLSALHAARINGNAELTAFLVSRGADIKTGRPSPEKLLEAAFNSAVDDDEPGFSILIARDGKVLFQKGYGLADLQHKVPITPQTRFRIGSITKQFTASAILKLQEAGKLSVADKLSKYIPDYPRGDEVTLAHLLTHTSGIANYTDRPGFFESATKPITLADLLQLFKNDPFKFDPGKKWEYSNSGYTILAAIVRQVTGETYADYLQKTFFTPLGMKSTTVHRTYAQLTGEALGYKFEGNGKYGRPVDWNLSRVTGAGDIDSTVEDLFLWNEAVFNGKVLSQASLRAAFTPVKMSDHQEDPSVGYGFGWGVGVTRGSQEITHSGGLPGYSTDIARLTREKFTVVVLSNSMPGENDPSSFRRDAIEFYLGEELAPRTINKVNPNISSQALGAIAGHYDYGSAVLRVTVIDGHAYGQLSGQPRFEIFPKSENEFFWKIVDAQVTFVKDEYGKVVRAIHHQGGSVITAPRMDLPQLSPADLDAILGKYDYGGKKSILTVTRDGDQVYAQLTGQPKFDILPKSATEFYWKVVDAHVTFVKDPNGKVTKVIHHQNGGTIDAPRID